ncbi:MAG: hypothetical protein FWC19_05595 [Treponema sp.]|nr:hypothetical protein [Treponema sp.]
MQQKSRGGIISFIAALCIIIYLFALAQAATRIYFDVDEQKKIAEQDFSRITGIALFYGSLGFMNEQFISSMNAALAASSCIEAVIITGPEGEYAFEKEKDRAVKWVNNSPRFINRLSFSNENYYRPLPIHDLRNANIKAVASAFNFNNISKILKETLLVILAGFTISFFTMLLQLLLGKSGEKSSVVSDNFREPEYEKPVQQKKAVIQPEKTEPETIIINAGPAMTERGPKGLYSSRSNIGWEEYTEDRLESELHRCSSTEKDLTLIIMELTDITNDSMYKRAAEDAASFFSSRDLLFENGQYGISVILTGVDLDTAVSRAEKFQQRIAGKFPHSRKSKPVLCIGLSSRAGRLLKAERLMFESAQALERAKRDAKSSIIAFKSDPEKYRAFIAAQN